MSIPQTIIALLLLCLLAVCLVVNSQAQTLNILGGRVFSVPDSLALEGANVYIPSLDKGVATDTSGHFSLYMPAGQYTVQISFLGFETQVLPIDLSNDLTLEIALRPVALNIDELEIIGDRFEEEVASTQMSAVSVPIEEIKKLPAFLGEVDVLKALQLLPGVQSGTEGSTGLYVRGGGPDQNLILLDGAPIYNASHVFGFLSIFNADALRDVQLIKGGFPARYGGRLSSVVDLSMKDGNLKRFEASGTVGLIFSSLTLQGPIKKNRASFIISARRTYIDVLARPFLNRNLPEGQGLTSYFYDTNAKLRFAISTRSRLFLSLYAGNDVYSSTYENTTDRGSYLQRERNTGGAAWGNLTSTLRWNHLFSENFFSNASLSVSHYEFDILTRLTQIQEQSPPLETFEEITYNSGITDLNAKIAFDYRPHPLHYVRFGGNLVNHAFNPGVSRLELRLIDAGLSDTTLTPNAFKFSGTEAFLYAEDEIKLSDRVKVNAGVHASTMKISGKTYTSLQPRLALNYLFSESWSLKASFGTMQQYLHLLTNTGINLPTDLWLAATERVGPQRAWQAALGTAYTFGEGNYLVSLESYYKKMRGLIEYAPGASFISPNQDWQDKVETGQGWATGVELFIRKKAGRATGWIGYTLSWSKRQFDGLNDAAEFPYRYDRRHDLSLVFSLQPRDNFDLGATWVYGTGQAITLPKTRFFDARLLDAGYFTGNRNVPELREYGPRGGYRMAAYHRFDLSLNWHYKKAFFSKAGEGTLSVGAFNVYNRKNPFYLFTTQLPDGSRQYKQASLFPVLPYIAYRFNF